MTGETLVELEGVSLGYGHEAVVRDLRLRIERGDFLGIVGPNGAGKTTILRGILGLLRPTTGRVHMRSGDHRDVMHFGYVPQRETVDDRFPLSVFDVVEMGRYRRIGRFRRPGARDRDAVRRALETAGIADRGDVPFRSLSGGQRQRALVARALAGDPDLLVLDEPTSGLDLVGSTAIMTLIHRLHRERGLTTIMVSHQLNIIARWVERAGILHGGRLELGSRDEIFSSDTLRRVYGVDARVELVEGHRIVLPPDEERAND